MSIQPPAPKPEILTPDEKPLIVQHEEIKARAKELDKKFAEVVEAHGDLSEIEAAVELINKERAILKEKKELRYALVKEFLLAGFDYIAGPEDLISEFKKDLVPFLIKALGDEDPIVRGNAAMAIGDIGFDAKYAVPNLIKALDDKEDDVRSSARDALSKMGSEAVSDLVKALEDKKVHLRIYAVEALSNIGPDAKDAVPALIKILDNDYWDIEEKAADALGNIGPDAKAAVPALIKNLGHKDEYVKCSAASALGKIGPAAKDAVPDLIEALDDEYYLVRQNAAAALGKIGHKDPAAIKKLEKLSFRFGVEIHDVYEAAIKALDKLKGAE